MRRHATGVHWPWRMRGGRRRPLPVLAPGTAARSGILLLYPLAADLAVYHESNYAIVANLVQHKIKKVNCGCRVSSPLSPLRHDQSVVELRGSSERAFTKETRKP